MSIRSRLRVRTRLRSIAHRVWPPKPKPLILMYHRIADDPIDHWRIAVSPVHFEQQLDVLRRTRHPLPLADFVQGLMAGSLPSNAVALTFDDGYIDNLVAAKPRLAAADIPATVFLTTGFVGQSGGFWWDELARLILLEDGSSGFELVIRGQSMHFDIGAEPPTKEYPAVGDAPLLRRRAAIAAIWQVIRRLGDEERELVMAQLRSIFSGSKYRAWPDRVMTGAEVQALVENGLVTIGAHTVTHPVLAGLESAACHREIVESKLACEALVGAPVTSFAYPYGDFDPDAREAVKTAGFSFACSVRRGPASAASDIFALPRIHISDCDGDTFERTLRSASIAREV
jgi:peptidoglycan/xylan/chitin deacetylase (PgdA/CDA1 family)